jgi:hypothetical protein
VKCKWCEYVAVESKRSDGKTRELFEDLKLHVSRTHREEYREFERRAWAEMMAMGRRLKKFRAQVEEID